MFQVNEMIVYGKHGVCKVVARGKIDMPMIDKNKEYYTLLSCKEKASVVYAPVENNKTVMRYVLTQDEVNKLLKEVPALEEIWIGNEREREACYKEILGRCDCRELIRILKTLYLRKQSRLESGKKTTAVDERYFYLAEEQLYGELSFVLGKTKEEILKEICWE